MRGESRRCLGGRDGTVPVDRRILGAEAHTLARHIGEAYRLLGRPFDAHASLGDLEVVLPCLELSGGDGEDLPPCILGRRLDRHSTGSSPRRSAIAFIWDSMANDACGAPGAR